MTPFRKPWDDPEIRKYLGMPATMRTLEMKPEDRAAQPRTLEIKPEDRALLDGPGGGMQLASPAAGVTTVIPRNLRKPEVDGPEPQSLRDVDEALDVYDRAKTYERKAVPTVDRSQIKGDYFDDELAPIMQPKEPEPIPEEKRPSKFWRILAGIDGNVPYEHFDRQDAARERRHKEAVDKQQQEQLAKPTSKESRQAQNKWRSYLNAAGYSNEEIGRMSAKDMEGFDLSDVSKFAHAAIQKRDEITAKAQAEQAALLEKRKYEEGRDGLKTEAEKLEWDRRNGVTSEQSMDRTRVLAGDRAYATRLAGEREDKKTLEDRTIKYADAIEKSGLPKYREKLSTYERLAQDRLAKKGKLFDSPRAVALVGNSQSLPFGEYLALVGQAQLSPEDEEMLMAQQALVNVDIKNDAGSAVSGSEDIRKAVEQARGVANSPDAVRKWVASVQRAVDATEQNLVAGYGPKVRENYQRNRGAAQPPKAGKRIRYTDPGTGKVRVAPVSEAAIQMLTEAGVGYEVIE